MGKYGTVRQARYGNVIWRVRVARSVTKATDTPSEYVIVFSFSTGTIVTRTCPTVASTLIGYLVMFCTCEEIQVVGPVRKTVIPIY